MSLVILSFRFFSLLSNVSARPAKAFSHFLAIILGVADEETTLPNSIVLYIRGDVLDILGFNFNR